MNQEIESIYQIIGQSIVNSVPRNWTRAWIDAEITDSMDILQGTYIADGDSVAESFEVQDDAIFAFERLQLLMKNPPKPNWKKAHFELAPDGKFDLQFEY